MNPNYEEGCVCLYKNGYARIFSKHEVKDALDDGWFDNPSDSTAKKSGPTTLAEAGGEEVSTPKRRGRPPKVQQSD